MKRGGGKIKEGGEREEKAEEALNVELPTPCNLLRERGRRSQGEGNTQQGGSSREQRPFTLTHRHTHSHANTHMNAFRHTHAGSGCVATGEREGRRHS